MASPFELRTLAVKAPILLSLLLLLAIILRQAGSVPQPQHQYQQQHQGVHLQQHPYDYFQQHQEQQFQHHQTQFYNPNNYPNQQPPYNPNHLYRGQQQPNQIHHNFQPNYYEQSNQFHYQHNQHYPPYPEGIEDHLPVLNSSKWDKFWDRRHLKFPHVYKPDNFEPNGISYDQFNVPQPQRWIIYPNRTFQPYMRGAGLPLPLPNSHPPKCTLNVPAVFFQHEKDVPIVGNNTLEPFFNVIEVCCPGYKRYDYDWSVCVPDCGDRCQQNSFCLEGGICQCFDEFVLNHRYECISTCPLGCLHGQCYLNGTCRCDSRYELDPTKKFCIPICDPACGKNEECIEPGKCECQRGYARSIMTAGFVSGCQPICIPDCGYGHCVAPNTCQCFPGFQTRINGTICEANCYQHCVNGFCANLTNCVCRSGYRYDFNTSYCMPDCGDNCENGVCTSPGHCRCFDGYLQEGPKCSAICDRTCGFYGKCIAPNKCGCALTPGPLRTYQRCDFGECTSKGRCRCERGKTRFIDQCLPPDEVTTYATVRSKELNRTLSEEFHRLIGQYFVYTDVFLHW